MSRSSLALTLPTLALRVGLFSLRNETKVTQLYLSSLRRRNQGTRDPVVAAGGPVVSLTSYGERLKSVYLVMESIAAGSVQPSRLILWVDTQEAFAHPSSELRKLMDRGAEVRLSDNFGPHTKYFPYLESTQDLSLPLVTADDDLLYSRWWLEGLIHSYSEGPENLHCYRAHLVGVADGGLAPYRTWQQCRSSVPSFLHFPTGVSGCIYPPTLQRNLKAAGPEFLHSCPQADDLWIHVQAMRSGIKIRQVRSRPLRFPFVPGTQDSGLYHSNVVQDRNDEQISKTYKPSDIALLHSCLSGSASHA